MSGDARRPIYARALRLRYIHPGGLLCFLFFEGMILLAVLLALAELVTWWVVLILPASVAAMVKMNDVIAGLSVRQPGQKSVLPRRAPAVARGSAAVDPQVRAGGPQPTDRVVGRASGGRAAGRAVGTAPAPGGPGGLAGSRPARPGIAAGGSNGTNGSVGPPAAARAPAGAADAQGPAGPGDAGGPAGPGDAGGPAGAEGPAEDAGPSGDLGPGLPLRRTIRNQRRFERPV